MDEFSIDDCAHMARALQLARRGQYTAHPNPMVGCVIARGSERIAEGWHQRTGGAHAEVAALSVAGDAAKSATAYVTLEPCAHHGRTPPCTDALIAAGVARVVIAMQDPFTEVSGRGIASLRAAGIQVDVGLMSGVAALLIRGYLQRVQQQRPFVTLKLASSLDGAIAMNNGESQWITSPAARNDVQRLRARSGAIMTGIGTVLADDPSLNVRASDIDTAGMQPLRVVIDNQARMPSSARMLTLPGETLVCCSQAQDSKALQALAEVLNFSTTNGSVDLAGVIDELGRRRINDVLVEAGPTLAGALLQAQLVNELVIYQAPHMMGSMTMRLLQTPAWLALTDRLNLTVTETRRIGADTRITASIGKRQEA